MKIPLLAICLLLSAPCARAEAPAAEKNSIGELPEEKSSDLLRPKERNPFVRREVKMAEVQEDKESEESKLRGVINSLKITGVIRGGGTMKVLLGDLILKPGAPVPPLIEGQTEQLVVGPITDKQLEIDFVETESRAEPRKILVPIDLKPKIKGYIAPPRTLSQAAAPNDAAEH